ncbi:MAG: C39 family peptidase [Elusimicrobia bacterium]|nr:C39 family peptidase [Elusimicrobiota bacterium]
MALLLNKGVLGIVSVFVLFGCSSFGPKLDSSGDIVLPVKRVQQERNQCGVASAEMLLDYCGVDVPRGELVTELYNERRKAVSNIRLYEVMRWYLPNARIISPELGEITAAIKGKCPVLVIIEVGTFWKKYHSVVVYGYNDLSKEFLIADPADRIVRIKYSGFYRAWKKSKYFGIAPC